jgi:hypothetical protein
MMRQPTRCTAIDALKLLAPILALAVLLCTGVPAFAAAVVGTVVNLSGPLVAKRVDGSAKILSVKSSVEQGDLLVTEKETYARIKFVDNSEITLKPNTQFKIENFHFDEGNKDADEAKFSLVKGGLRAVTGALGKRSKERFGMNTPTATIGIRGTIFVVEYVSPTDTNTLAAYLRASVAGLGNVAPIEPLQVAQADTGTPSGVNGRPPGLYLEVIDGLVFLTNPAGTQDYSAGQFGYVPNLNTPPIIVPQNPGMEFNPPPAFNSSQGGGADPTASSGGSGIDCQVR